MEILDSRFINKAYNSRLEVWVIMCFELTLWDRTTKTLRNYISFCSFFSHPGQEIMKRVMYVSLRVRVWGDVSVSVSHNFL